MHNNVESHVSDIWREILALDAVDKDRPFFDLGGNSLAATLIAQELARHFAIKVTPGDVYANPTVQRVATLIRDRTGRQ